jgi:hypothetical protein
MSRVFETPIVLDDGRTLLTIGDAHNYVTGMPENRAEETALRGNRYAPLTQGLDSPRPTGGNEMAKLDDVTPVEEGFGFMVRQDNNQLVALFAFDDDAEARAAHEKIRDILSTCRSVWLRIGAYPSGNPRRAHSGEHPASGATPSV